MMETLSKHKSCWSQKSYRRNVLLGFLFLAASLVINGFADIYTTHRASNPVTDVILDNIPTFNVNFIFYQGFAIFWLFVILLQIREPKGLPFMLKSIALFILIRSFFISLTHLAIPLDHSYLHPARLYKRFTAQDDLFFSSHTGLPFLMSLIYWEDKRLRKIFLAATLFFGATVLLGHLHYSIDVFSAFFITYGIFHIARTFFAKDYSTHIEEEVVLAKKELL
ncbi:MAG: phosphatase PAP2-related protein [Candidatus Moranbacteria bacterium]|nr:phosphatase PAP2-related protein [Candidatus Moranbacteria bacterium]